MRRIPFLLLALAAPMLAQAKLIIGIAGGTGSGKSTLSETLINAFTGNVVLVNQDNYYKSLTHLSKEERAKQNFDHPDAIDFKLLETHLIALKNDKPIESPTYNFTTHSREAKTQTIYPADIIIVEGILLFAVPEVRNLCDLKIFVETDDDIRLLRRIERDIHERGRTLENVRNQYLTTVKPMHDAFVEPSKRFADVIIPTSIRNDTGVAMIISSLKAYCDMGQPLTLLTH